MGPAEVPWPEHPRVDWSELPAKCVQLEVAAASAAPQLEVLAIAAESSSEQSTEPPDAEPPPAAPAAAPAAAPPAAAPAVVQRKSESARQSTRERGAEQSRALLEWRTEHAAATRVAVAILSRELRLIQEAVSATRASQPAREPPARRPSVAVDDAPRAQTAAAAAAARGGRGGRPWRRQAAQGKAGQVCVAPAWRCCCGG